ncbi:Zinc finger homeobox protein 3 [Galemys pyrenaicus]|uniref:Zinc finger homeobox protein 3 n=1 Tax=Galemys pyrenaicus TaxID=202257 RepID=A0A8J6DRY4_GALPY|nr:Zinc finger homeobox protein 3 [Galemys pyrenaicus]
MSARAPRHLQQHESGVEGESCYYHCVLCNYSTKAKLNLIQHVRSMKHQRSESLRKLQRLQKGLPEEDEDLGQIFTIRRCPSTDPAVRLEVEAQEDVEAEAEVKDGGALDTAATALSGLPVPLWGFLFSALGHRCGPGCVRRQRGPLEAIPGEHGSGQTPLVQVAVLYEGAPLVEGGSGQPVSAVSSGVGVGSWMSTVERGGLDSAVPFCAVCSLQSCRAVNVSLTTSRACSLSIPVTPAKPHSYLSSSLEVIISLIFEAVPYSGALAPDASGERSVKPLVKRLRLGKLPSFRVKGKGLRPVAKESEQVKRAAVRSAPYWGSLRLSILWPNGPASVNTAGVESSLGKLS